ncbi:MULTISPECIES: class I SAM-dependent methyltransferase [unclassified Mycolicibacterium]|uniref:class I SAM-dependent methyltransferase n=1 Tax=unclassified Mycolicibacterium TaxID=2636767 RepID=UPI0012DC30C8|nr:MULTISPECIES: class I SAM-dependent methyltransferase [unclassified Mycolicibacterium]MUL82796.1 class I SAM-dependent methyltransferase [Mycolicibacterium sp. CBMA 329]MUL89131.1 class I SAM-dependent methyltransferase [Mycolicibacterium sp. CBMA 331]MUL97698.1 class I SAM-dependent methyltransferase [Mycolicibacterium sp. CBMA 334]MUM24778.1 class I SAM-dependent methyltransferase [Mycolicibacterium sp. CBMA 295]MUM38647.1 class I SAM-dependent methyltransferase [Mycolicibacterium sp. CBM
MTTAKIDFSSVKWGSVEWTNLCTLYLRACESRLPQPVLGDHAAAEAVDRIDYDFKRMHRASIPWANQFLVALRAKQLDDWTANFLTAHQDAVVLHLGCGLDTRAFRVNRPETVDWFDVDQPGVIDLRRKLYDDGPGYRMIGSSVTEAGWLDQTPTGRPTLIVAEGLLMYLAEADVRALLQRLTDRFDTGEIAFDTIAAIGPKMSKLFTHGIVKWGIGDVRELQRWNPRLRLLDRLPAYADYQAIPMTPQRRLFRFLNATLAGRYDVLNLFAF